jgi:hypothetical protein
VIYGYLDDTPFVLGKMPDFNQPWRVPGRGLRDTFDYDDFEGCIVSGATLYSKFWWALSSTANSSVIAYTIANHPGDIVLDITTAGAIGNYSVMYIGNLSFWMPDYHQFEWCVEATSAGNGAAQALAGLTDHSINFTNCCIFTNQYTASTGANRWWLQCNIGGVNLYAVDLGMDYVSGHFYILNLRNLDGFFWVATVVDTTTGAIVQQPIKAAVRNVNVVPCMRLYNLTASGGINRQMYIDYFSWSKRGVVR